MVTSPSACIQLKEGTHIAKCVLMPGDPLRAKYIAETYLENPVLFNDVRNMLGYTGTFYGKEISVMGSGMGIPSMLIYANELYNFFDVDTIIRVGSAGGIQEDVHLKDVVFPETAFTNSSCVEAYKALGLSKPLADKKLLDIAKYAADELGVSTKTGPIFTTDYFYNPDKKILERLESKGFLAVEMETAGLYTMAMYAHKKALGLFTISDHLFKPEHLTAEEIRTSFHEMMEIALKTAAKFAREHK